MKSLWGLPAAPYAWLVLAVLPNGTKGWIWAALRRVNCACTLEGISLANQLVFALRPPKDHVCSSHFNNHIPHPQMPEFLLWIFLNFFLKSDEHVNPSPLSASHQALVHSLALFMKVYINQMLQSFIKFLFWSLHSLLSWHLVDNGIIFWRYSSILNSHLLYLLQLFYFFPRDQILKFCSM